jgi:ATP-binding cassette subfamily C protein CydCD
VTTGVAALEQYLSTYLPALLLSALAPVVLLLWLAATDLWSAVIVAATVAVLPLAMILLGAEAEHTLRERWAERQSPCRVLRRRRGRHGDLAGPSPREPGRHSGRLGRTSPQRGHDGDAHDCLALEFRPRSAQFDRDRAGRSRAGPAPTQRNPGLDDGLRRLVGDPEVYLPLRRAGALYHGSRDALGVGREIIELLALPYEPLSDVTIERPTSVTWRDVNLASSCATTTVSSGDVAAGDHVALRGPSGAGKTSLLRRLAQLDSGDGTVSVDGYVDSLCRWSASVGYLEQNPTLLARSVREVLDPEESFGDHECRRILDALALTLELGRDVSDAVAPLSAGERRRLALGRLLLLKPAVLLLDEPTAHLDGPTARRVWELLAASTSTIIAATHDELNEWPEGAPRCAGAGRVSSALLSKALAKNRSALAAALLAQVFVAVVAVALAATSAWLLVRASQRPAILSLSVLMGSVQLFALAKAVGRYLERLATHRAALAAMNDIRVDVAAAVTPLLPRGLGPRPRDAVRALLDDVEEVESLLVACFAPLTTAVVASVVTVVLAGLVVPSAAIAAVALALVTSGIVLPALSVAAARGPQRQLDEWNSVVRRLSDDLASHPDLIATAPGPEDSFSTLAYCESQISVLQRRLITTGSFVEVAHVAVAATVAWITMSLSARAVATHHLAGTLAAVLTLSVLAASELVTPLSALWRPLSRHRRALARLDAYRQLGDPALDGPVASVTSNVSELRTDAMSFLAGAQRVDVADVTLRRGDVAVLRGASGAGKSTFAATWSRFLLASDGDLKIEGQAWRDVSGVAARGVVGAVDDEPYVFHTSLRANLALARDDARDDEMIEALERVGLGEFLRQRDGGLDSDLGGAREGLSGRTAPTWASPENS